MTFSLKAGDRIDEKKLMRDLVALQYKRNDAAFERGTFRRRGDTLEIYPAHYEDRAWRISLFGDEIETITEFDPLTGKKTADLQGVKIYANSHYVTPRPTLRQAINHIKDELKERLDWMVANGKLLEAQRLEQRTTFDIEMIEATGSCAGIENYSRYLTGRRAGRAAADLLRIHPRQRPAVRRREPPDRAADRRHVPRRLPPQVHPGRVRLPPARPASTTARSSSRSGTPCGRTACSCRATPGPWEMDAHRRRVRRAGDPPHRPDRPAGGDQPGAVQTASARWTTSSTRSARWPPSATAR